MSTPRKKKPTAQRKPGRTALKRPPTRSRSRASAKKASPAKKGPWSLLGDRPAALAGVAVALLLVGMGIGYLLGGGGPPPAREAASSTATPTMKPVTSDNARRSDPATLEAQVRAAQEAPDYQDGSVTPPGQALPGVRITDPPEGTGEAPPTQVAAVPTPPADAVAAPAWMKYAVAPPPVEGRPMIAIVIDDMGVDKRRTRLVENLPGPLTTSFLTYAPDGPAQARSSRDKGHEILLHVPMEPFSANVDPGPGVLLTAMDAATIRERLAEDIASFEGYVGINNHMGSKFTSDAKALRPVIETIRDQGLLWLDSRTTAKSVGVDLAREVGVPFADRNIFLDHHNTLEGTLEQLSKLEAVARKYGYGVAIGHPKDHTIAALKQWLPTLRDKGLVLVPLSTIVRARMKAG